MDLQEHWRAKGRKSGQRQIRPTVTTKQSPPKTKAKKRTSLKTQSRPLKDIVDGIGRNTRGEIKTQSKQKHDTTSNARRKFRRLVIDTIYKVDGGKGVEGTSMSSVLDIGRSRLSNSGMGSRLPGGRVRCCRSRKKLEYILGVVIHETPLCLKLVAILLLGLFFLLPLWNGSPFILTAHSSKNAHLFFL